VAEEWKTWDFDEYAENYDGWVTSDDPIYAKYGEVLDFVVSVADLRPEMTALDIGTGTGNLALLLAAPGVHVVGVDPSRRMLAKAGEKIADRAGIELRYVEQPFLSLPYPDDSFDAVVSTYSFHHVPPPMKPAGVKEMLRVLKPGRPWVLGDMIFRDADSEREALERHEWLEEEYYPRIDELAPVFTGLGMELRSRQFTPITWVLWALKPRPK
jgi:ubiquinone/menaquinone biosynthesis C-methylase UbiE